MSERIEQIRRAHKSARPNAATNPAWANCHHDCGVLLAEIDRLKLPTPVEGNGETVGRVIAETPRMNR